MFLFRRRKSNKIAQESPDCVHLARVRRVKTRSCFDCGGLPRYVIYEIISHDNNGHLVVCANLERAAEIAKTQEWGDPAKVVVAVCMLTAKEIKSFFKEGVIDCVSHPGIDYGPIWPCWKNLRAIYCVPEVARSQDKWILCDSEERATEIAKKQGWGMPNPQAFLLALLNADDNVYKDRLDYIDIGAP